MLDWKRVLAWCVLVLFVGLPAVGATVESIPKPQEGTWTVDTLGRLRAETLAEVNRLATQIHASGQGQIAVVMVDSTEGRKPRAFATDLFNRWGIGHADRDDGALLFVAMNDRKVEIVLGDGVDSAEDIRRSDAVMAHIIPLFKQGDADSAVLEGTRGLSALLAQHSAGASPAMGMSLGGGLAANQLSSESGARDSSGFPFFGLLVVTCVVAGIVAIIMLNKNSGGPRKPRSSNPTFWGGGGYFGGGGYSGGSSGGGGGFGGGSSSGGGSSGGF